jgi:hypothetical protein
MRYDIDAKTLTAIHAKATTLGIVLPDDQTAVRWALCRGAGIGMVTAPAAPPGECQRCHRPGRHLGRFLDDAGVEWAALCGGCKVRLTMTPKRREALGRLAGALLAAPVGDVIDTTGEPVGGPPAAQQLTEPKEDR